MADNEQSRLETFQALGWPHPATHKATPAKLAASGFFLVPTNEHPDRTVCYCCGVGLVNWSANSDPWYANEPPPSWIPSSPSNREEHIRRSPTCGLVTGHHANFKSEIARFESFVHW